MFVLTELLNVPVNGFDADKFVRCNRTRCKWDSWKLFVQYSMCLYSIHLEETGPWVNITKNIIS